MAARSGEAGCPLRVNLMHPTYWPEVRRGSERLIHGLGGYLNRGGFEVTVLTAHRARRATSLEDGIRVVRAWRPPARLKPARMESYANHAGLALAELVLHPADLVHSFHIPIAWAATGWSAITSRPLILSLTGYPDARSLAAFRGRERMLRRAAARARRVHVLSLAAARALKATTGIDPVVLHPGTDLSAFRVEAERAKQPTILCAASPADPRKRVPDLVAAFSLLRRRHPDARLLIDCGGGRPVEPERLRAPGVELIDVDTPDRGGIAKAYATSWLSVLPSEREAFGLVLVESLAAGTPAVGMWDGAAPEIIDDPRVGVVAQERSPEALATALGDGLELAARPETRERCRSHSTRWGWDRVGPAYEQLYADALAEAN